MPAMTSKNFTELLIKYTCLFLAEGTSLLFYYLNLKEESWSEVDYRRQHVDHIVEVLTRWTRNHTTDELVELGQLMHFPWAPVNLPQEVFHSPQLKARDFFVSVGHDEASTSFVYPGVPYKFSGYACNVKRRAPMIGEHNTLIYQQELGFSSEKLAGLSSRNVI